MPMTVNSIILVDLLFLFPDISFHCGWHFISFFIPFHLLEMHENFSVNRVLADPSETDKDTCTPQTGSIIQHCLASLPISSKLVHTSEAEFFKRSTCSICTGLPELALSLEYRYMSPGISCHVKVLNGLIGKGHLEIRSTNILSTCSVTLEAGPVSGSPYVLYDNKWSIFLA